MKKTHWKSASYSGAVLYAAANGGICGGEYAGANGAARATGNARRENLG